MRCNLDWFDPVAASAPSSVADMNALAGSLFIAWLRWKEGLGDFVLWLAAFPFLKSRYLRSAIWREQD